MLRNRGSQVSSMYLSVSIRPVSHAALLVQYDSASISLCGRECDDGGGEEEGDAPRSFPHRRFGGSDAGSSLARETHVLEYREVKEYASWDAYVVLIDKCLRWLR